MASEKERVAFVSMLASAGLALSKGVIGVATGSLAILSEAAHSAIDFVATVMTYFAVRIGDRPADEEHHYGHGKVESIAALAETALLFVLAIAVLWEAGKRLLTNADHVEATAVAFVVMAVSVVVDFLRARALNRVARETHSEALEADALHFSSDMWSSGAVIVGLAAVALGLPWADSAAAAIVAVFIALAGFRLGKRTIETLTDTAPAGIAQQITAMVSGVRGVVAVENVRVRKVGATLFVELTVAGSRTLPLDRVAAIKDEILRVLRDKLGEAEIALTFNPRALDSETVMERVMVIARNRALAVHHVTVQAISGRLSVSLDLEVDGALPLGAAHDIATGLERAIQEELGSDVEVETHIEPLQTDGVSGTDAPGARVADVTAELTALATRLGSVREVHDVRVRDTADGEIVTFHCVVDPALTVHQVHEMVDEVERGLRRRFPSVTRVISHAEPAA
jgi:cation diffusion facilitator family transporter